MSILEFNKALIRLVGSRPECDHSYLVSAFQLTVEDIQFHYEISADEVLRKILSFQNETVIFLYRLGNLLNKKGLHSDLLLLSGAMKLIGGCEIYFNNEIDVGFFPVHSAGVIIGSRNRIGKGFKIYQGVTIGHTEAGGRGNNIGDNVTIYANSSVLGELTIGDQVIIGAHSLILKDVESGQTVVGKI